MNLFEPNCGLHCATLFLLHILQHCVSVTFILQQTVQYLTAVAQLAHNNTDLAHTTWLDLFPRIWKILSEKHQQMLSGELIPFLCSGSHVVQKDCHPSAIHTFVEALSMCVPPVSIRPIVLKVSWNLLFFIFSVFLGWAEFCNFFSS